LRGETCRGAFPPAARSQVLPDGCPMRPLILCEPGATLSVLCIGAHSDDIEIGIGGTILSWIAMGVKLHIHWCVLSAIGSRAAEAEASAAAFLNGAASVRLDIEGFKDGFFPYQGSDIKRWMEDLKLRVRPDVLFTHRRDDAHQDHREISNLTWCSFRDHLILEYEIPKWDGDLGQPNFFYPLTQSIFGRKVELLAAAFATQRSKDWFNADVFHGLARLRGMECRAPEGLAEGFVIRKALLGSPAPAGRSSDIGSEQVAAHSPHEGQPVAAAT
jgi:LmbE family N-acetylglucosaminyl deacetylase